MFLVQGLVLQYLRLSSLQVCENELWHLTIIIILIFTIVLNLIEYNLSSFEGQVIFAGGGLLGSFTIMQIGRFVFGIGGESLAVAQNTYAVTWFKGKELNMVFGFQVVYIYYVLLLSIVFNLYLII